MEFNCQKIQEKRSFTYRFKRITAALLLLLSNNLSLPQKISTQEPSKSAKSENNNNSDILKYTSLETIYDPEANYSDFKTSPEKINILEGITVTKASVPEIGHVNGCTTWMADKYHWIVELHCSASVESVVWSDILPAGFGSYVTNVYSYSYNSGLGIKILEVKVELSDSKPQLINSSTPNIQIGDSVRVCGYGLHFSEDSFPSSLSCATMSIYKISELDGILGTINIGQGFPFFGDSGAALSIFDEDLKKWIAVGTQRSISPDLDKATFTLISAPQVIEFLKAHIPDAKFFSRTFLPKVSK